MTLTGKQWEDLTTGVTTILEAEVMVTMEVVMTTMEVEATTERVMEAEATTIIRSRTMQNPRTQPLHEPVRWYCHSPLLHF